MEAARWYPDSMRRVLFTIFCALSLMGLNPGAQ
jgi:hypothetical protein